MRAFLQNTSESHNVFFVSLDISVLIMKDEQNSPFLNVQTKDCNDVMRNKSWLLFHDHSTEDHCCGRTTHTQRFSYDLDSWDI